MKRRALMLSLAALCVILFMPGIAVSIFSTWAFFCLVRRATPEGDRKTVVSLLASSLALRIIVFCALQFFILSRGSLDIFGDAQDNIINGIYLSDYFRGGAIIGKVIYAGRYNTHSMSFFNGIFFTFFGKDFIALKYMNLLAITAAGWLIYDFLRRTYSSVAGKIASAIFLFWPTIIAWSITDLKEAHLISCLVFMLWLLLILSSKMKFWRRFACASLLVMLFFYVILLKSVILPIIAVSAAASIFYYFYVWLRRKGRRLAGRFVFMTLLSSVIFILWQTDLVFRIARDYYSVILSSYRGFVDSGGWNYSLFVRGSENYYTPVFFAKHFVKGWFHFMTEPLPWHLYSHNLLLSVPVVLLWYALLFCSIVGLIKLKRFNRISAFIPMLAFAFFYITVLGMSVANIGTVIRFRDSITFVVVILASLAFCLPDREKGNR